MTLCHKLSCRTFVLYDVILSLQWHGVQCFKSHWFTVKLEKFRRMGHTDTACLILFRCQRTFFTKFCTVLGQEILEHQYIYIHNRTNLRTPNTIYIYIFFLIIKLRIDKGTVRVGLSVTEILEIIDTVMLEEKANGSKGIF